MDKFQAVQQVLTALLFLLFHLFFSFLQRIWWIVTGVNSVRNRRDKAEAFSHSAHVLDIWWRYKLSLLVLPNSIFDFITVHNRFDHPAIVLKDNVTIYAISSSHVIFVETDIGVDAANSKFSSFMKVAQFVHAKRVIIVPIRVFHQVADQLGDPQGKLVFVGNTGRCGSTLLCQIYEQTERCVAFSEPEVITYLCRQYQATPYEEFSRLAISTVRMLCKVRSNKPDAYVIKIFAPGMANGLPALHKVWPQAKLLFMYREGLKMALSTSKVREEDVILKVWSFSGYNKQMVQLFEKVTGVSKDQFINIPASRPLAKYFKAWAVPCATYIKMREAGFPIVAVKYEDMLGNAEFATRAILHYSGLETDDALISKALTAFSQDSQIDSPFSQQRINRHKPDDVTPEVEAEFDVISSMTGVPRASEPCVLDHTITAQSG